MATTTGPAYIGDMFALRITPAFGTAAVLALAMTAGACAPRAVVQDRPAPQVVPVATPAATLITDTPPAVHAEAVPAVLQVITGVASYYSSALEGRRTASGEPYDPAELTAAHRDLPFGTRLRVTNPANGRSVEVRVTDRGPFTAGRVLDVSRSAAEALDMIRQGIATVRIEVLGGGDD